MAVTIAPRGGTVEAVTQRWTLTASEHAWEADVIANVAVSHTYHGAYAVTPSQDVQTLQTSGLMMADNVTIGAIPSNYGLITWDGYAITVS